MGHRCNNVQQCATRSKTPTFRDRPRQEHDSGESEAESNESRGGVWISWIFKKGVHLHARNWVVSIHPMAPLKLISLTAESKTVVSAAAAKPLKRRTISFLDVCICLILFNVFFSCIAGQNRRIQKVFGAIMFSENDRKPQKRLGFLPQHTPVTYSFPICLILFSG